MRARRSRRAASAAAGQPRRDRRPARRHVREARPRSIVPLAACSRNVVRVPVDQAGRGPARAADRDRQPLPALARRSSRATQTYSVAAARRPRPAQPARSRRRPTAVSSAAAPVTVGDARERARGRRSRRRARRERPRSRPRSSPRRSPRGGPGPRCRRPATKPLPVADATTCERRPGLADAASAGKRVVDVGDARRPDLRQLAEHEVDPRVDGPRRPRPRRQGGQHARPADPWSQVRSLKPAGLDDDVGPVVGHQLGRSDDVREGQAPCPSAPRGRGRSRGRRSACEPARRSTLSKQVVARPDEVDRDPGAASAPARAR